MILKSSITLYHKFNLNKQLSKNLHVYTTEPPFLLIFFSLDYCKFHQRHLCLLIQIQFSKAVDIRFFD